VLKILRVAASEFETPGGALDDWRLPADAVWIELVEPTRDEELCVERELGVALPTREEMAEIEPSSRLYQEGGATFMTARILYNADTAQPSTQPITFVLAGHRLVTIRYFNPKSFTLFSAQALRQPRLCPDGPQTFVGLIDAIVDRTADVLERTQDEVDALSREVFDPAPTDFEKVLTQLGRAQSVNAKIRESLVSLARLAGFAGLAEQIGQDPEHRDHLSAASRDVQFLLDHSSYVSSNISFMHDAALGLINLQQNKIIKIFSVAAVAFLPPTMIASIYGMNFEHMPELGWELGYPMAIGVMFLSAAVPLWVFRRVGWL
jgi:magnesium transporter